MWVLNTSKIMKLTLNTIAATIATVELLLSHSLSSAVWNSSHSLDRPR